jgi:hypothetical protein
MKEVIATLQSDLLHAAGIWVLLVSIGLLTLLLFKSKLDDPELAAPETRPDPSRERRRSQHTQELTRYAREVTVAADRAAVMAERRREEWLAAQAHLDETWNAYEASEAAARRMSLAAALPTPKADKTPAEYAFRERFLHRAAMAACSRKQLSALDLSDALAHRKGWDPTRHPADQEIMLRRAIRDSMWASYRSAAERERAAWRAAETANEAKTRLREEARLATARARQAAAGRPLALVGDTITLPQLRPNTRPAHTLSDTTVLPQLNRDTRPAPSDTMVLPQLKPDRRGLVSDTMVLPQLRPDRRGLTSETMVLPQLNRDTRSAPSDTMVLPQLRPERLGLTSDTMALPSLG